ncbi:MAG: hypothetical protein JEY94_04195 [Melioribacteraceae bacterium]|nr:hypothetical protein [Melioribacteraceae bacterium]
MSFGKIIAFSGLDGSGKSTQIDLLKQYLSSKNIKTKYIWSRGGYTPLFNLAKSFARRLLGKKVAKPGRNNQREKQISKPLIAKVWLLIAMFDLFLLYGIYFRILRLFGYYIIADRYIWDTLIDFRLNFSTHNIENWFTWKMTLFLIPNPSAPIYLDIPLEISLERLSKKDEPFPDSAEVLKNRLDNYNELITNDWFRVNANDQIEVIHNNILKAVNEN